MGIVFILVLIAATFYLIKNFTQYIIPAFLDVVSSFLGIFVFIVVWFFKILVKIFKIIFRIKPKVAGTTVVSDTYEDSYIDRYGIKRKRTRVVSNKYKVDKHGNIIDGCGKRFF